MLTNDTRIRNSKPATKAFRISDGRGLYLLVQPNGSKWWRFDYRRPTSGRNTLSLGVYPDVPLKLARERRDQFRQLVAAGVDPAYQRETQKVANANTFEAIAREWFLARESRWAKSHSSKIIARLEADLFPWLGKRAMESISAADVLSCLRRIEQRGAIDTAHRALQNCGQVFRYAVATSRAPRDPCGDLRGALIPVSHVHYPTIIDPCEIGALLRAIDAYGGSMIVRSALRLAPLVFVRPGELRAAEWKEVNFEKSEWRIRAERMKSRVQHIVPLSRQALAVLRDLWPLTGDCKHVFPGIRHLHVPMSENTVNVALRSLGYGKAQFTGHGFRSMASTYLNECGKWSSDVIERQLAHGERDEVRAAYNYAMHLPVRREMMQYWADELDRLRLRTSATLAHP